MLPPKLKGKTKSDLIEIAHLSGLLTSKETNRMTKAQILECLQKADEESQTVNEKKMKELVEEKPDAEPDQEASKDKTNDREIPEKTPITKDKNTETSKSSSSKKTKTKSKVKTRKLKATDKKIIDLNTDPSDQSSKPDSQSDDKQIQNSKKTQNKEQEELEIASGILEIMPDNYGFLRVENYLQSNGDLYVPPQFIRRFNLRDGDKVTGPVKVQRDSDRYKALTFINTVNDLPPDQITKRPSFDRLTPIYPNEKYTLETEPKGLATRMIDLVSPIGKGQRGMIVSPPKAGKTILLQKIANSISINNPEAKLFVLLIDERPEEVTDMQRSINGEVVYSTFDKTPENHVKVTELVLERAMRLVELGTDVVILLDSITRMSRAYNLTINPTGRTLSGGLDPGALYGPKRFFGAARNIEFGGSLTIIATALVETGSRMDEVIFEEFKGTGNMEVHLDRKLAEKRIFPAIDLNRSSTRREELLMTKEELNSVWTMRKAFSSLETAAVTETVINLLHKTRNNEQLINSISVSLKDQDLFEAMRGSMPTANGNGNTNGANRMNGKG
ncbi:MAG TPA: transcription termination factor Rho [Candidatus Eisenbacteria bacterium]|nr:transcription termination factor Rho [Candidatus Eisenbacteria bacterium]